MQAQTTSDTMQALTKSDTKQAVQYLNKVRNFKSKFRDCISSEAEAKHDKLIEICTFVVVKVKHVFFSMMVIFCNWKLAT